MTKKIGPTILAYCYANGVIKFRSAKLGLPKGALPIVKGPGRIIRERISSAARHGYNNKTLLVPGVPEADDRTVAVDALVNWVKWCVPGIETAVKKNQTVNEELGIA